MYLLLGLTDDKSTLVQLMMWHWAGVKSLPEPILTQILRLRRNDRHFAGDIFKFMFLYENIWISIKISLKFVPKGPINNIPTLVQIMAWCRSGDKPLSEPVMESLLTHICVTPPQWVHKLHISMPRNDSKGKYRIIFLWQNSASLKADKDPFYSTKSVVWLLITSWCKVPSHQQT